MLRFTLRQLEYALAAYETGSIAKAAAQLGIAQPTLSAAIAKLEDQLGAQLFIRHHAQGVSPIAQSMAFFTQARNLLAHATDLERTAASSDPVIRGSLSLGSFTTLASAFAPRLLASFLARHPDVSLKLFEGTQDGLLDGLRLGRFDSVLLYDVDLPKGLAVTHLARLAPHILLPARHRLAKRGTLALKALAEEKLILLDIEPSRTYFLRLLRSAGVEPQIAFSSPSLEVVRGLVGRGLGYSVLISRPHGDRSYAGDKLAIINIAGDAEPGVVALATRADVRKTRLQTAFESHCRFFFKAPG